MSTNFANSPTPALPAGTDVEAEYTSIERALLESARGRWFLAEHGRRARRLDSARLDDALAKLHSSIRQPPALLGQLRNEASTLREELSAARARSVGKVEPRASDPTAPALLSSVETLHNMAWDLQAAPVDEAACQKIAGLAAEIYAHSVNQAAQSKRALESAAVLDAAILRLDGILQSIDLEAKLESAGS